MKALWSSTGGDTICSTTGAPEVLVAPELPGRLAYQPKTPALQAAEHCSQTIGLFEVSTMPAVVLTVSVCTCRFVGARVGNTTALWLVALLACARVSPAYGAV